MHIANPKYLHRDMQDTLFHREVTNLIFEVPICVHKVCKIT